MSDWTVKELEEWDERVCNVAVDMGLDWFPINYDICDYYEMIGHMSYHGLPSHYDHWSYGKSFERTHQMYNHGQSGLPYELIINSNPSIAYLMKENPLYLQILIMAHCVGHSDFFKNNLTFANTRPDSAVSKFRNAKKRIKSYMEDPSIGIDKVEELLDNLHSIKYQVNRNSIERIPYCDVRDELSERLKAGEDIGVDINQIPLKREYDLLAFFMEQGKHFADWELDVINVVREESLYFIPQIKTKIMNEGWACVTGDTLIDTTAGLIRADEIVGKKFSKKIFDGKSHQAISNWFFNKNKNRIKITTDKGYVLHGGEDHKIQDVNGDWIKLNELKYGDEIKWQAGNNDWPLGAVEVGKDYKFRKNEEEILRENGVTWYLYRKYRNNTKGSRDSIRLYNLEKIENVIPIIEANKSLYKKPENVKFPAVLNEDIATLLGLLISDGGFGIYNDRLKGGITSGDDEIKELCENIFLNNFGVVPKCKKDENRWRISIPNESISDWLVKEFDLCLGKSAHIKRIPAKILRSPKHIVEAFLRGLFDGDGYAGNNDVIYTSASYGLTYDIQAILTKMGIFCKTSFVESKNENHHNGYRIRISGFDVIKFRDQIGFNLKRKQEKLENYIPKFEHKNKRILKVVNIEKDIGDTFDFTVDNSHQYLAGGFINHNCHWHYKILNELKLPSELHIPFIKSHNQVIRPHVGGINPYHLGFEMFQKLDKELGRDEIFMIREVFHDESFLRNYLDLDQMIELNLFSYSKNRKKKAYVIDEISDEDGWRSVKNNLIKQTGVGGIPKMFVEILEPNGTLVLGHDHDGRDLELNYANVVVNNVAKIWEDVVKLETIIEEEPWEI